MAPLKARVDEKYGPPKILRKKHTYFGRLQIPFYNEELDMSQGNAHAEAAPDVGSMLKRVRVLANLSSTCDNPIAAIDPRYGTRKIFFPDFTLLDGDKQDAIMTDVRLAIELVTITTPQSEAYDTVFKKELYCYNGVPEYLIIFPDKSDERVFTWYKMVNGNYELNQPAADGRTYCGTVPGFAIEPLPVSEWQEGRKLRFYFDGIELRDSGTEYRARLIAEKQLQWAQNLAGKEKAAKESALAEKESALAEKESALAEKECALARLEKERVAKEAAQAELEQLRARLGE